MRGTSPRSKPPIAQGYGEPHRLNRSGNRSLREGDYDAAVASFRAAMALSPNRPEIQFNLGLALSSIGLHEDALAEFEQAASIAPEFVDASVRAASALERLNRLDEAGAALARARRYEPDHDLGCLVGARLAARSGDMNTARATLENLLERKLTETCARSAYFDLGRVCDRVGDYGAAFRAFTKGNALVAGTKQAARARAVPYVANIERHRAYFTVDRVDRWTETRPPEASSNVPVFLVGFPRSGTTLVEQVFGAHPNIMTTDEFPLVDNMILNLRQVLGRAVEYPDDLATLEVTEIARLRAFYRWAVKQRVGTWPEGTRLVDKFPLNLIHLGMVRRVFPEAKVIVALRDPRDVCLSCFEQDFSINPGMVHCLDLRDTANLYAKTMSLWQSYERTLKLDALSYRYEDLVDDVEGTARTLFRFIGEPWDKSVLSFHEHAAKKQIRTPSYEAVTKPVYRSATGRWRNYATNMAPVLATLAPFVDAFGYPPE
jgi:Flp pilus assembly protein TadD